MSTEDNRGNLTLKDVARLAGVSRGTVDRVIHNRGNVSKQSYDNVMRIIKDIGYEPNIYASILAHDKNRVVALLLPQGVLGNGRSGRFAGERICADLQRKHRDHPLRPV